MDDLYMEEMDRFVYRPPTPFEECVDRADSARGDPRALSAARDYVHEMHDSGRINGSEFVAAIHHIRWLTDCCRREGTA